MEEKRGKGNGGKIITGHTASDSDVSYRMHQKDAAEVTEEQYPTCRKVFLEKSHTLVNDDCYYVNDSV